MNLWSYDSIKDKVIWNMEIAEQTMVDAVDHLVDLAPPAKTAVIVNLGDYYHVDDNSKKTKRSGNLVDVDGRQEQAYQVGIRILRRCIDRALEKHENVHVICEIGNHDDLSAYMLALCIDNYYHTPRS